MNKRISMEEAESLLEKYYEGATSGAEERQLQEFLLQSDLPERFEAERALFGFIAQEKQLQATTNVRVELETPPSTSQNVWLRLNPVLKWSLAAAVLAFGVLILDNRIQAQNGAVAYIDGIRCTDKQEIKALAIASIDQLDLGTDEVAGTVEHMNDVNLVESQLQLFPELK